jgi:hypothetical protein
VSAGRFEKQWRSYRARVVPADAPAVQVVECRRAFYAGAQALRAEFCQMMDDPRRREVEILAIEVEIDQFGRDVKAGVA